MKKILFYILILITLLSINTKVDAQTNTQTPCAANHVRFENKCIPNSTYILLAPLPCDVATSGPNCVGGKLTTYDPTGGPDGKQNILGTYINTMLRIFIGICAVLAMIMIILGGLEYMTSEVISSKEAGKEKITGAVLGLMLALGSWALLNTINPKLLDTGTESLENVTVVVDLEADIPQTYDPITKKYNNGALFGADWSAIAGQTPSKPEWASVNRRECTTVGEQFCTSTKGLGLSYLLTIRQKCPNCQLRITGGTEFWLHGGKTGSTSHGVGSSTVDLEKTAELNKYIAGDRPLIYWHRYEKDGISYLYEGNHWHAGP